MSVTLEKVSVRFRAGVEAVRQVTLDVAHGEFVAIVGPSGCGKSTLLSAIADLLDPLECEVGGRILVDGAPLRQRSRREANLGYVFQRDGLLPWQTISQNVQLGLVIRGVDESRRVARTRELIEMAGLAGFEAYYPHQVSGGMRQRAALVRTLAYDPQTILMDEPFGALDAQNRMILQSELLRIWQLTPRTILFVTHDLAEAIILAQRVVVLSRRPGAVKAVFDIDLPYPRDAFALRGSSEFATLETTIWQALRDEFRA
jgi:NitT/TauT family transport system ATP-binding protein